MDNRNTKDNTRTPSGPAPKDDPVLPDPKPTQPGFNEDGEKR